MKLQSRYQPSRNYWRQVAELDGEIVKRTDAAGQVQRYEVPETLPIYADLETEARWHAGGSDGVSTYWRYGSMSVGWRTLGYLRTADTHLVVPAGAEGGEHALSTRGRFFHYTYPPPFAMSPRRLDVHELPDFCAERDAERYLGNGNYDRAAQLGALITPGREEYELLLAQITRGASASGLSSELPSNPEVNVRHQAGNSIK